ncbi:sigma-70 family RNA polymerase sigma factor [Bacillus pumilus]|uniref:sigma-70 family RNA polymerase sigma factor n=1 Tax=Bacillus pumilus TaxID=1408 RepID=UPI00227EB88D|nr:sigma-70 family RNA polymerase sigma factor [Bacillus pumilus]MCY7680981.1 sigma-70 family RNA polymerase sigma factor [Bacillus pumilus]
MDTMIKKRIKQLKKGDQNAFADIVDLYKDKIYQLCYRMLGNAHEAEDIAQEAGTEGLNMYSQIAADGILPEEEVVSLELSSTIQQKILRLPDKYRSVIVLKYIDELSLKEISEILNIPVGTVKTRIHRGREALRKQLRDL